MTIHVSAADVLAVKNSDVNQQAMNLNFRFFPLTEPPYRIAHVKSISAMAVLTARENADDVDETPMQSFLQLVDAFSFDVVTRHAFEPQEYAGAVMACQLNLYYAKGAASLSNKRVTSLSSSSSAADDVAMNPVELVEPDLKERLKEEFLVVGVGVINSEEEEPTAGRVIVFRVTERKIKQVAEIAVNGGTMFCCLVFGWRLTKNSTGHVYSLANCGGKIVAAVGPKTVILQLVETGDSSSGLGLVKKTSFQGHTIQTAVRTRDNTIVVGDMIVSTSVLSYSPTQGVLTKLSQ